MSQYATHGGPICSAFWKYFEASWGMRWRTQRRTRRRGEREQEEEEEEDGNESDSKMRGRIDACSQPDLPPPSLWAILASGK
eukprot:5458071-Pyramimonas_sp.AAC.2